jgi:hypothetical protein
MFTPSLFFSTDSHCGELQAGHFIDVFPFRRVLCGVHKKRQNNNDKIQSRWRYTEISANAKRECKNVRNDTFRFGRRFLAGPSFVENFR